MWLSPHQKILMHYIILRQHFCAIIDIFIVSNRVNWYNDNEKSLFQKAGGQYAIRICCRKLQIL